MSIWQLVLRKVWGRYVHSLFSLPPLFHNHTQVGGWREMNDRIPDRGSEFGEREKPGLSVMWKTGKSRADMESSEHMLGFSWGLATFLSRKLVWTCK